MYHNNKRTSQSVTGVLGKTLLAALLVIFFMGTVACSSTDSSEAQEASSEQEDGLVIVASIFAPYDFARTLAGDVAEVTMLVPPGAETHSFEPTPADLMHLNTADVFIYVGGESDAWLEKTLDSLDNPDLTLIKLVDLVETLDEVELEGMDTRSEEASESEEVHDHADEAAPDEHVWTSVRNAQLIVASLAETFAELDALHAEHYNTKAQALINELVALDERFTEIVADAKRTIMVFGDRFPFLYFARDYGLECYAAFPGCSTAVDTNPETLTFLIEKVRQENIPAVFYIELSDERIAHTLAEETSAQTLLFHSAHNISKDDFDAGVTYVSLMQQNAHNLEVALN